MVGNGNHCRVRLLMLLIVVVVVVVVVDAVNFWLVVALQQVILSRKYPEQGGSGCRRLDLREHQRLD